MASPIWTAIPWKDLSKETSKWLAAGIVAISLWEGIQGTENTYELDFVCDDAPNESASCTKAFLDALETMPVEPGWRPHAFDVRVCINQGGGCDFAAPKAAPAPPAPQ